MKITGERAYIVFTKIRGVSSNASFPFFDEDMEIQRKAAWDVYEEAIRRGAEVAIISIMRTEVLQTHTEKN